MHRFRAILMAISAVALSLPGVVHASVPITATTMSIAEQQKQALIGFNGVYALANTANGFFSVDTNMFVSVDRATPRYVITLGVSLDGKTSRKSTYSGSFDGNRLRQASPGGPAFDLTFTRNSRKLGPTVSVAGTVALPGQPAATISGVTYDNPITPELWGGHTYFLVGSGSAAPVPFVRIEKNGDLFYNPGSTRGKLAPVNSYTYNMDEYYFSFDTEDGKNATFIMGTAGQAGLTMNNIVYDNGQVVSQRSLVTMPKAPAPKAMKWYPELSLTQSGETFSVGTYTTIADFSGYWPLQSAKGNGAFVAIQGENLNFAPGTPDTVAGSSPGQFYNALISVSLDGKTVSSYYFDISKGMTFDGRTLRMPSQRITLTFAREYDPKTRSLYRMTGTIRGQDVTGSSLFNNTPVGAFAGTLTDATGKHVMDVTAAGVVVLDGQVIENYVYVPMMYILAGPLPGMTLTPQPVIEISFGHAGAQGMAAIVTTGLGTPSMKTFNMYQVPSGS
jgi:hypothetical protein